MSIQSVNYGAVQTAYVGYVSYNLQTLGVTTLTTFWPTPYTSSPNILAATTNIVVGDVTGGVLVLPNANEVSLGMNVFIRGDPTNATTFAVQDNEGVAIQTISGGTVYWIQLVDYTPDSTAGTWISIQQGAGTSSADAASLVGYGLAVEAYDTTRLNTIIETSTQTTTYTVQQSDQSSLILLGGGSYVVTIPAFFNGFDVSFNNTTEGVVTLTPAGGTINGDATLQLYPTQTVTLVSDGTNLWSLGLGQSSGTVDITANIQITSGIVSAGYVDLTPTQVSANIIQIFTNLTNIVSDVTLFFGSFTSNWIVNNLCPSGGGGTISVQLGTNSSSLGDPIIIPYGQSLALYSAADPITSNLTLYSAPSTIVFGDGSISTPAVTFQTDSTSGLYLNAQYIPAVAAHGVNVLEFSATSAVNPIILANPGTSTIKPTYSFIGAPDYGVGYVGSGTPYVGIWTDAAGASFLVSNVNTECNNGLLSILNKGDTIPMIVGAANSSLAGIGLASATNTVNFFTGVANPPVASPIMASIKDTAGTVTTLSLLEGNAPTAIGYIKISGTAGTQVLALGTTTDQVRITAGGGTTILDNLTLNGGFAGNPTTGDICYYDGTKWINLVAGTDGDVLTLAGGVPTWA